MTTHTYDNSLLNPKQVVKSLPPGNLADQVVSPCTLVRGTLVRAERTAGELAVSGIHRESRGEVKTLPGFPKTNLELLLMSRGFPVVEGLRRLLPEV